MSFDTARLRQQLFNTYACNLTAVKAHPRIHIEPDADDIFVCPLCFKYFTRSELEQSESPITLEHVPPESVGGQPRTLTCCECNSWSGHYLDSHLAHRLDMLDFAEQIPDSQVDVTVIVDDAVRQNGIARYTASNELHLIGDPERSDPAEVARLVDRLEKGGPMTFTLITRGRRGRFWRGRRWEPSLLRSAYLWAFSVYGYGFLINHAMPAVRGQIKYPSDDVLPTWGIWQNDNLPDELLGMSILRKPAELRSFVVSFDIRTALKKRRYCVMLPGPTAPGALVYKRLKASVAANPNFTLTLTKIPEDPEFLTDPAFAFASYDIWKEAGAL